MHSLVKAQFLRKMVFVIRPMKINFHDIRELPEFNPVTRIGFEHSHRPLLLEQNSFSNCIANILHTPINIQWCWIDLPTAADSPLGNDQTLLSSHAMRIWPLYYLELFHIDNPIAIQSVLGRGKWADLRPPIPLARSVPSKPRHLVV